MLLANTTVAEFLEVYCKDKTLLRSHPDLKPEKKEQLKEFYEKVGLKEIDLSNSKTLSVSMENLRLRAEASKNSPEEASKCKAMYNVAQKKFLNSMQPAKYVCINEDAPD